MKRPRLAGDYVHVYDPRPDRFAGPDSARFRAGERYENWVPNDFTVIHDGRYWHLIGITHPCPEEFVDAGSEVRDVHEAEWQLFHAVSTGETLKDSLRPGGFEQVEQILPAPERPGERREIWAPIIWKVGEEYVMLYSPDPIRRAVSGDLAHWTPQGEVIRTGDQSARDPNIMEKDGVYTVIYLKGHSLYVSESEDLLTFRNTRCVFCAVGDIAMESPILKYVDGTYYLFYCGYNDLDRVNGYYDNRTFVYASRTLEGLDESRCVASLAAHAPELFQDEVGDWYLASVEWPHRGVSIAPVEWVEDIDG